MSGWGDRMRLVDLKRASAATRQLAAEVDRLRTENERLAALRADAAHRLSLLAERTADYTPEGLTIRLQTEVRWLAAAVPSVPAEQPVHADSAMSPNAPRADSPNDAEMQEGADL